MCCVMLYVVCVIVCVVRLFNLCVRVVCGLLRCCTVCDLFACFVVCLCLCVFGCFVSLCALIETDRVMLYGVVICWVSFFLFLFMLVRVCVVCGLLRDGVWFVFCAFFCVCLRL